MPAAFVFPGQGAQAVGMGQALYERSAAARQVFAQADEALADRVAARCFEGPEDELRRTIHAQPAIVAMSLAAHAAFAEYLGDRTPRPVVVAGHSVGTYAALAVAGALDVPAALRLVRERARCMEGAGERAPGAMAAVLGAAAALVEEACAETRASNQGVVAVANYNAPDQIVVSGSPAGVERVSVLLKERGARRIVPLAVSGAFHSPLMDWAVSCFERYVRESPLRDPQVPIISNLSGALLTTAEGIRGELAAQVRAPVQWVATMDRLAALGVTEVFELGPGQVLAGLLRRKGGFRLASVDSPAAIERAAALVA